MNSIRVAFNHEAVLLQDICMSQCKSIIHTILEMFYHMMIILKADKLVKLIQWTGGNGLNEPYIERTVNGIYHVYESIIEIRENKML